MTETDKKIAACVDQIKHDIDRLAELAIDNEIDLEGLEDHIINITNHLILCKQRLTIEHGGLTLTKYPPTLPKTELRPVICIETGETYESITQASIATGINGGNISLVVRGINRTAGGYHWEELEVTDNLKGTSRRSRLTRVVCVETGEIFNSIANASRATKISPNNISAVINGKHKTAGGYHWRRYEGAIQDDIQEIAKQEQRVPSLELIEWADDNTNF